MFYGDRGSEQKELLEEDIRQRVSVFRENLKMQHRDKGKGLSG